MKSLQEPSRVKLHSDSAYPINCMNQKWYGKWRTNGWRNSKKKPVENKGLWKELLEISKPHEIRWIKVRDIPGSGRTRCAMPWSGRRSTR